MSPLSHTTGNTVARNHLYTDATSGGHDDAHLYPISDPNTHRHRPANAQSCTDVSSVGNGIAFSRADGDTWSLDHSHANSFSHRRTSLADTRGERHSNW